MRIILDGQHLRSAAEVYEALTQALVLQWILADRMRGGRQRRDEEEHQARREERGDGPEDAA